MLTRIWSSSYFRADHLYEKDSEYEIHRLTTTFKVPATRQRFDNVIQAYDLSTLRSTAFIGALLSTLFVMLDFIAFRESFIQIAIVRLLLINACILFALYLTYIKPFRESSKALKWLGVGILSIVLAGHFFIATLPDMDKEYILYSTIVILIFGNCLMFTRFPTAVYVNIIYFIVFQILLYYYITVDLELIVVQSFVFIAVMVASLHACYLRERNKCLLFVQLDIANKQKKELETVTKNQEELLDSLDYKNQELEQYAFVISHDLKSPLRVISGLTSIIQRKEYDNLNAQSREDFNMVQDQILQMEAMISGVLEYSQIGQKNTTKEAVDIVTILESLALTLGRQSDVNIDFPEAIPLLEGSAVRFKQVFQNLISNAIKYNNKTNCVILITAKTTGDFVQFSLQDNGPGIRSEYAGRIFQLFQTLQSKQKDSTGVGLAIVKKIIDFYEGEIYLDPHFDEGARFCFTLPILSRQFNID